MLPSSLINALMKQAQPMMADMMEKVKQEVIRAQNELDQERLEVSTGAGMVKVVVSGMGDVLEVKLDPAVVDPNEIAMLQDLLAAAVREANKKAQERHAARMAEAQAAAGIQLPPGLFGYQ